MGFQQGLSGLSASSRNMDVIGHNIANANTVGMKSSRAEFAELVASSVGVAGGSNAGIGVTVATVAQQFSQGNITITGNELDVAINGGGFFQLQQGDGSTGYTRAGNFKMNADGNLMTNSGSLVMGYTTDVDTGAVTNRSPSPIVLPTATGLPGKATQDAVPIDPTKPAIKLQANLDARAVTYDATTNIPPYTTYGTSLNAYNGQGTAVPVSVYFTKTANPNEWNVYGLVNGAAFDPATPIATITFDGAGMPVLPLTVTPLSIPSADPAGTAASATIDLDSLTQFGSRFAISSLEQNGYAPGEVTGVNINEEGLVMARYSNGKTQSVAKVTLVNFRNVQGLSADGGGVWQETRASGQPIPGEPGIGNFGGLRSGSLEDSNVDLTAELVNMMTAQRAYQANAQTIKTQDQVLSTLVNMR